MASLEAKFDIFANCNCRLTNFLAHLLVVNRQFCYGFLNDIVSKLQKAKERNQKYDIT